MCRWMLLSLDRLPSNQISMTEKLIGNMLGLNATEVRKVTACFRCRLKPREQPTWLSR
jgi:hypothetical protein